MCTKRTICTPQKAPKRLRVSALPGYHRATLWPCKTSRDWLKKSRCSSQQILVFRCCFWRLTESCSQASFARHQGWQLAGSSRGPGAQPGRQPGPGTAWAPLTQPGCARNGQRPETGDAAQNPGGVGGPSSDFSPVTERLLPPATSLWPWQLLMLRTTGLRVILGSSHVPAPAAAAAEGCKALHWCLRQGCSPLAGDPLTGVFPGLLPLRVPLLGCA